jgi:hypothetical protein
LLDKGVTRLQHHHNCSKRVSEDRRISVTNSLASSGTPTGSSYARESKASPFFAVRKARPGSLMALIA